MNDDSQIKNETDQELLNLLKSISAQDKKFRFSVKQLIIEWATTRSIRTKVDTDKCEAPRPPYFFETDINKCGPPRMYFHANLADMKEFNVGKKRLRPKYCLVMIDGESRKIYLRSCLNKKSSTVIKLLEMNPSRCCKRKREVNFLILRSKNGVIKIEFVICYQKGSRLSRRTRYLQFKNASQTLNNSRKREKQLTKLGHLLVGFGTSH